MTKKYIFKYILSLIIALAVGANITYAADVSVRIETPKTPTNKSFNLGFVALDTQDRTVNIDCLKKGPTESSFSVFSTFSLANGGDSGDCSVDGSVLNNEGSYDFKVIAQAGSDVVETQVVSVFYDATAPGRPENLDKEKKSSCKYKISFKTADDGGETDYVEVYRSADTEFSANASTRADTISIGSNQTHEYTDEVFGGACGETQYYAVRAFDNAGNASGILAEEIVTIITKTVTETTSTSEEVLQEEEEEQIVGAQPIEEGAEVGGEEQEGEVVAEEPTEEQEEEGEVLGEGDPSKGSEQEVEDGQDTKPGGILQRAVEFSTQGPLMWVIPLVVIAGVLVLGFRNMSS